MGNVNGMPLNDSRVLEYEADVMGQKALNSRIGDISWGIGYKTSNSFKPNKKSNVILNKEWKKYDGEDKFVKKKNGKFKQITDLRKKSKILTPWIFKKNIKSVKAVGFISK
jgi:hypothetical protein